MGRCLKDDKKSGVELQVPGDACWIVVMSDSDVADCTRTRTRTSGGLAMFDQHRAKSYSDTYDIIELSSGELEFYGIVTTGSIGLGVV